jgi:hypothetical protein
MEDSQIEGWVNPLAFLAVDEPWASMDVEDLTMESALRFLCPPDEPLELDRLVARYRAISTEPNRLFIAPLDQRVLDKLVWPLRHAKASYMVGNYLATIALSGMVAEMVALLMWEMTDSRIQERPMTELEEAALLGSRFERLGQERRVKVLAACGICDSTDEAAFDSIRIARRRYLHLWSQDHDQLPADAIASFHAAVGLVVRTIGQDVHEGRLQLSPRFARYLAQRQGLYEASEGTEATPD